MIYAIAIGVVITLVIIRQLQRGEKAAGETLNSNATARNSSKSKSKRGQKAPRQPVSMEFPIGINTTMVN